MLTAGTGVKDSAGYVAIEKVVGVIDGHQGLSGIAGKFEIEIKEGKHSYDFEYTLPQ